MESLRDRNFEGYLEEGLGIWDATGRLCLAARHTFMAKYPFRACAERGPISWWTQLLVIDKDTNTLLLDN